MSDFFEKEEYTEEDINRIISEKWEESLNLEFKSSDALVNTPTNKHKVSKVVSSFANSAGGIIIYGISENTHVADSKSFIDGNIITKEWLEQVINSNIHRKIESLTIFPIRFDDDITTSVYIVKIPESVQAPHMANDKRYYKRHNFQIVEMEEYEVRNLYNRKLKTDLSIQELKFVRGSSVGSGNNILSINFKINFMIKNLGNTIEDTYKLEIKLPNVLLGGDRLNMETYLVIRESDYSTYSIPNTSPLFQDELSSLPPINVVIIKRTFQNSNNLKLIAKLFYSSGSRNYEYNLAEILKYNDDLINESMFIEER